MFHVGFGSANRETEIRSIAASDRTTALVLAAVHFEWMLKRAILKLGLSPTKELREELERVYTMQQKNGRSGYQEVWEREVGKRFKNSALGSVLGKLEQIQRKALDIRGKVIHGNGTVGQASADEAIELFLGVGDKLRGFAGNHGVDLDTRLNPRHKVS